MCVHSRIQCRTHIHHPICRRAKCRGTSAPLSSPTRSEVPLHSPALPVPPIVAVRSLAHPPSVFSYSVTLARNSSSSSSSSTSSSSLSSPSSSSCLSLFYPLLSSSPPSINQNHLHIFFFLLSFSLFFSIRLCFPPFYTKLLFSSSIFSSLIHSFCLIWLALFLLILFLTD